MTIDLQLLVNIIGALAIIYLGLKDMRNKNVAGDVSVSNSWSSYVKEIQTQNAELRTENLGYKMCVDETKDIVEGLRIALEQQERAIAKLTAQVKMLETQLIALGKTPFTYEAKT